MPTLLISNWYDEIQKFFKAGTFKVARLSGRKTEEEILGLNNYDIVLTSYESLRINHKLTGKIKWKVIVCDEAQKMKNPNTILTTAIKTQNVLFKIACSATPIENSLIDLWCLTDFVKPDLLSTQKEFNKEYNKELKKKDITDEERQLINNKLKNKLSDFYLRRTKDEELSKDFPKKKVIYDMIPLSEKQKEEIRKLTEMKSRGEAPLAIIQGLIMACSHPLLIDRKEDALLKKSLDDLVGDAQKLAHVKIILEEVRGKNEKAIIFTKYRVMQEILKRALLEWFGINVGIINGEKDNTLRKKILDEFKKVEGFNIIILSPEAAGVGLNIVEANHVIHYTRHWNPAKEEQATDRAYRIGQKKDVYVYYPIVSYLETNDYKRHTYETVNDWIDDQINKSLENSSPEEKLNKIIMKKKRMLKDFFLASFTDVEAGDFDEFKEPFTGRGDMPITMDDVDLLNPNDFEKLAVVLYEKLIKNSFGYVTVASGDYGIDGVILSPKSNILIQCKHSKKVSRNAYGDLTSGEKFYKKELDKEFDKLVLFTSATASNISSHIDEKYDEKLEIIDRKKLAKLLLENEIYYSEINEKGTYSIESMKNSLR